MAPGHYLCIGESICIALLGKYLLFMVFLYLVTLHQPVYLSFNEYIGEQVEIF